LHWQFTLLNPSFTEALQRLWPLALVTNFIG
jgi:hypothetical protein